MKKVWAEIVKYQKYICIMANGSKLHIPLPNYHLLAAQQEPCKKKAHLTKNMLYTPLTNYNCTSRGIQKSPSLEEKYWIIFWRKKCQENVPLAEK